MLAARIPVETMAIDSGMNAELLAVRILASGNPHLIRYLREFRKEALRRVEIVEKVD
jgi:phosphoribosylcarboxyaminoimidazole (NCAIR) mutase